MNLCFLGCVRNQKMGGYSVCVDACVCAAYAWLRVLCMSCYAICVEACCVAAFPCRQHFTLSYIYIYIPTCDLQHRPNPEAYNLNAAETHLNILRNSFLIVCGHKNSIYWEFIAHREEKTTHPFVCTCTLVWQLALS